MGKKTKEPTIEEQIERVKVEIKELSDEAKALDSQLSRLSDFEEMVGIDEQLRRVMLLKKSKENLVAQLAEERAKRDSDAALKEVLALREKRKTFLSDGWTLQKKSADTLRGLWREYQQLHKLSTRLMQTRAEEDELCKRYKFAPDQIVVAGRSELTKLTGGPLPTLDWGGFERWVVDIISYSLGRGGLYSPDQTWTEQEKEE